MAGTCFRFLPDIPIEQIYTPYSDVYGFQPIGNGFHWCAAALDSEIISFGALTPSNPYSILSNVGTKKAHRRKGAATFLLREMHKHFAPHWGNVYVIWINTENSAANGLFEKVGYEPVRRKYTGKDVPKVQQLIRNPA